MESRRPQKPKMWNGLCFSITPKAHMKNSLPWMAPLAFHNTGRCLKEKSVQWNSHHSEQLERMWSEDASGFGNMPKVQAYCWTHKQQNHRIGRSIYSHIKPSAQIKPDRQLSCLCINTFYETEPTTSVHNWFHCQIQTEHCVEKRNWSATPHQKIPSIGWLLTFASKNCSLWIKNDCGFPLFLCWNGCLRIWSFCFEYFCF